MTASNGTNNANGIISLVVLACGITFSALIGAIVKKAIETQSNQDFDESMPHISRSQQENLNVSISTAPLWSFGFAFIIPGLLGFIGTFAKSKGLYITQMVFSIISLLVMGVFFIISFFFLGALIFVSQDLSQCHDVGSKCMCSGTSMNYSCEDMRSIYAMGIGLLLMIVLGWILLLTTTVLGGILACRQQPQAGMIINPPMTSTVVQLAPVAGMGPPQVTYMPQAHPQVHDQAQLVHNMEY